MKTSWADRQTDSSRRKSTTCWGIRSSCPNADPAQVVAHVTRLLNSLLGSGDQQESCQPAESGTLDMVVGPFRQNTARKLSGEVRKWVLSKVDDETVRIQGAQWLARWFDGQCKATDDKLRELQNGVRTEMVQVESQSESISSCLRKIERPAARSQGALGEAELLNQLCRFRLFQYVVSPSRRLCRA